MFHFNLWGFIRVWPLHKDGLYLEVVFNSDSIDCIIIIMQLTRMIIMTPDIIIMIFNISLKKTLSWNLVLDNTTTLFTNITQQFVPFKVQNVYTVYNTTNP